MSTPRTIVLSRRALEQKVWQASQYEFEDVVAQVDDAVVVAPPGRSSSPSRALLHGAANRVRRRLGRPRRAPMVRPGAAFDVELAFAVFAAPHEIAMLPLVREHLDRASARVAYIVELWRPQLAGAADYLRQLRGFDHIFMFNRESIPDVQQITGVPCSYLPTAVDTDLFSPHFPGPTRSVDVTSYGRRLSDTHEELLGAMGAGRLYYHFDTVRGAFDLTDPREHRAALAALLQRSRYGVVYKNNDEPGRRERTAGEESLTNRYFETLAAGAVLLGSAPDGADFTDCFDWPDAIVPIRAPARDVVDVIRGLDSDPARLDRARRAGVAASLRRHDWAHRWREVLAVVGLEESDSMAERLQRLESRAELWDGPVAVRR